MKNDYRQMMIFLVLFEILSFFAYSVSGAMNIAFILVALLFLAIAFIDLRVALLAAIAELFIGGMGYLFYFEAGGFQLSLRIVIFLILFSFWLMSSIKSRGKIAFFSSRFKLYYLILFIFLVIGLINAFIRQNGFANIFFDFNAYIFFAYLFMMYDFLRQYDLWGKIWHLFIVCFSWLGIKTMLVLYFFSHGIEWAVWPLYHWVRNTGVGEITLMTSNIYRVFFQSHIYILIGLAIFAVFLLIYRHRLDRLDKQLIFYGLILGCATIFISASRSFWAGALACLPLIIFFVFYHKTGFNRFLKRSFFGLMAIAFGFLLIFAVVKFPLPDPGSGSFGSLFKERANISDEAAASSRWNLWPELWKGIGKEPILGQGFGATITYISNDPRVREVSPTGEYTTYAFEWGLLDIWYKIGLLGVAAYTLLIFIVSKEGIKQYLKNQDNIMPLALVCGLIVLFVANFFTPYLNHPLGIGYLILTTVYLDRK